MIVADTGAVIALVDADDRHHGVLQAAFSADPDRWLLPIEELFVEDLATGAWQIEWGARADLARAHEIVSRHRSLRLGLVDAIVIAVAERLEAEAIATLDIRDFGAVQIRGSPRLLPRDL